VPFNLGCILSKVNRGKIGNVWWRRALLYGVPFGIVIGLFAAHRGHGSGLADGLINGIFSGALFGLAMGWLTRRQQAAREQRTAAFTAGLTAQHRTLAVRASRRGPIPDDPAIRAAAARLTRDQLERTTSQRNRNLAGLAAFTLLELVQALISSPWFWLGVLLFAVAIVAQLRQPRTLHRRLAQLNPAA